MILTPSPWWTPSPRLSIVTSAIGSAPIRGSKHRLPAPSFDRRRNTKHGRIKSQRHHVSCAKDSEGPFSYQELFVGVSTSLTVIKISSFCTCVPAQMLTRELCDAGRVAFRPGCSAQAFKADYGLRGRDRALLAKTVRSGCRAMAATRTLQHDVAVQRRSGAG